MKTKTGMSIGLALTLMVGVFATMLALGLFTNNEVRADAPTAITFVAAEGVTGDLTAGINVIENSGVALGTFSATYTDHPTAPITWALAGAGAAAFTLSESDGVLALASSPDFETPSGRRDAS